MTNYNPNEPDADKAFDAELKRISAEHELERRRSQQRVNRVAWTLGGLGWIVLVAVVVYTFLTR